MKTRSKNGSALLVVLAFIVIIAGVLLAYMAKAQLSMRAGETSASIVETDLLARTAEDTIINELRQEMYAGADGTNFPMIVTQPWAMLPSRVINNSLTNNTNFINLTKQSLRSRPFYPSSSPATYSNKSGFDGAKARASAVNTSDPAVNGRYISPARWNKPALLKGAGFTDNAQIPDWILITRSGVSTNGSIANYQLKDPSNSNFVIGRYAYNIYDVSGLLDINVAGFDPANPTQTSDAQRKGSMAWADLTAIPGIGGISTLVSWRNKESATLGYLEMLQNWGEPWGFKIPYKTSGRSDRRFFTRQDLLDYQANSSSGGSMQKEALPYLTTFSADLDQPSFAPDVNRPKITRGRAGGAGGNDAKNRDTLDIKANINPNVLQVRDGNDNPVVKRRFPLDRLKYVVQNPTSAQQPLIAKYFGLIWEPTRKAWKYQDGITIKTLSQVVAENREPNFVELLQAAITAGSLGSQLQTNLDDAITSPRTLASGRDGQVAFNVLQIAANIIDQYDADSYPTRILFPDPAATPLGEYIALGSENLPYIYAIRGAPYRVPGTLSQNDMLADDPGHPYKSAFPTGSVVYRTLFLMQPIIWNPHAPGGTTSSSLPINFKITATSGLSSSSSPDVKVAGNTSWWNTTPVQFYPAATLDARDDSSVGYKLAPATDFMTFQTTDTGKASFREPYTLKAPDYPKDSFASSSIIYDTLDGTELNDTSQSDETASKAIGFRAGWTWSVIPVPSGAYFGRTSINSNGITYELMYQDSDGDYLSYDIAYSVSTAGNPYSGTPRGNERPVYFARTDPRTDRFGVAHSVQYHVKQGLQYYWPQGETIRPNTAPASRISSTTITAPTSVNWNNVTDRRYELISENKQGTAAYYQDADGVARLAMGGYSRGLSGLPMAKTTVTGDFSSRPVILNRPFRSVAELGYAFRGTPWRQIDFSTPESGDAALLDYFCITRPIWEIDPAEAGRESEDPVVSGRFNLNTPHPEVIEAILRGVSKDTGEPITLAETKSAAEALVAWTRSTDAAKGPLRNRAELVGKYYSPASTKFNGFSQAIATATSSIFTADKDAAIANRRQSIMRGLVDAGTTRTWTFLIDLIVQAGRYPENATGLTRFLIKGERRYWVQVSIDRFTGKLTAKQVEVVIEQ